MSHKTTNKVEDWNLKEMSIERRAMLLAELQQLDQQDFKDRALEAHSECEKVCRKYGVSLQDVWLKGETQKGKKFPVLYVNPDNPKETWTGRYTGKPTNWLIREAEAKNVNTASWGKKEWLAFADKHFKKEAA